MSRVQPRPTLPSRADDAAKAQRRRIAVIASLSILAVVIIVAIALASRVPKAASDAPVAASLTVGQKAPEFALSTTAGPFDLARAGGKPTLLEVFATWCPHCQRETAVFDDIYGNYKGRINLVAVSGSPYSMDQSQPESQADVIDFATKFNVTYPVAFDSTLDVAHKYLQGGFPSVVLIGADGKVRAIRDGEIPAADLKKALDAALSGKLPDPKMGAHAS
ncbi:MAG: TlpA family protein disulfide reductase [Candidatus Eremiobacteraeota bacterium]|nr:TlpA family protein disulfide reductase [Candidatus Eremiobacteraeota bacterium]